MNKDLNVIILRVNKLIEAFLSSPFSTFENHEKVFNEAILEKFREHLSDQEGCYPFLVQYFLLLEKVMYENKDCFTPRVYTRLEFYQISLEVILKDLTYDEVLWVKERVFMRDNEYLIIINTIDVLFSYTLNKFEMKPSNTFLNRMLEKCE